MARCVLRFGHGLVVHGLLVVGEGVGIRGIAPRLGEEVALGPLGERMWQWYQDFKNSVMRKG